MHVREAVRSADVAVPEAPGTPLRRARWGFQIEPLELAPGAERVA
jgi:hypothetical protein